MNDLIFIGITVDYTLGALLAAALTVYLVYALIKPERF